MNKSKGVALWLGLLTAGACGGTKNAGPSGPSANIVSDVDFTKLDEVCPGEPRLDQCEGVTPRIKFVVKDETGKPLPNVLVGTYPEEPKRNADNFPAEDGLKRKKYYSTCTNASGEAAICPLDAAKTSVANVLALKPGYTLGQTGKVTYTASEDKTVELTISKDTAAVKSKVLILACERGRVRDPLTFVREHVHYTIAPFGKAIDHLLRDTNKPLEFFDTLYLGKSCASSEAWGELLVPEKNKRLWDWVSAGGLLFLAQLEDAGWSRGVNGCADAATSCSGELFPPELRFDLFPESPCNDLKSGSVVASSHPTMSGVDFTGWSHNSPSSPTKTETRVAYNLIKKDTVDAAKWTVLAEGPIAGAVVDECSAIGAGTGVLAMEATYGKGKVYVGNHAWETGSQGDISGGQVDPKGVVAKNGVFNYLKAHAPQ